MTIETGAGRNLHNGEPWVEVRSTVASSPGRRYHWLDPDEARALADDLREAADEVEAKREQGAAPTPD